MGFRKAAVPISACCSIRSEGCRPKCGLMMVSNKDNGEVFKIVYLLRIQFCCCAPQSRRARLLYDGTEPNRPLSLPPSVFLNTTGLMLDKKGGYLEGNKQHIFLKNNIAGVDGCREYRFDRL
jgi:hypothetical protein